MKLKEVYNLITGVILVATLNDKEIHYGNTMLPEPSKKMMEMEIQEIEPFYNRTGLFKYGVIIHLKEETK